MEMEDAMIRTRHLCLAVTLFVVISNIPGSIARLNGASGFSIPQHSVVRAENETPGDEYIPAGDKGGSGSPDTQGNVDSSLRLAVEHFIGAADRGDAATVVATYDPEFLCVRVADEGGFVQLTREQMVAFWKTATQNVSGSQSGAVSIPTQKTTIHHAEVVGDTGFVLLTRIKDIGSGWEPMFYSLVWRRSGGNWRLLREFVHQKSIPKQRMK